ncbi:hypothetical protein KDM41_12600 [bacterium]|nr:hypothetical protein [bacterium]
MAALLACAGCGDGDPGTPPDLDPEAQLTRAIRDELPLTALPEVPVYPPNNGPDEDRIALGRLLFFDPVLSGNGDVACATCHHPALAWADGRPVSIGVGGVGLGPDRVQTLPGAPTEFTTPRNSPTMLDVGHYPPFPGEDPWLGIMFWDGRITGLEEQARHPVRSRDEMGHDEYTAPEALTRVLERLQDIPEYVSLFSAAFPAELETVRQIFGAGNDQFVINGDTYGRAIAAYERELTTTGAPYDAFVRGDDGALSFAQKRGLMLFHEKGCAECHSGPMFSDFRFHALGTKQGGSGKPPIHEGGGDGTDLGRFRESGLLADKYAFRTGTLRNVALTPPYFHTGGEESGGDYQTLRQVIEFHQRGGNDEGLTAMELDPLIRPVELAEQDILDLIAFLESLTATRLASDRVDPTVPDSVPSGLTPPEKLPPVLTNDYVPPEGSP